MSRATLSGMVVAGDGADVDDIAFGFFEVGQGGAGYEEDASDVGGVDILVVFKGGGFEGLAVYEIAGVIDEDVYPARGGGELLDHFVDIAFLADIGLQ